MRFIAQHPHHPWWSITTILMNELLGTNMGSGPPRHPAYEPLSSARFSVVTPDAMLGSIFNPIHVARGASDVGVTTPTAGATMAFWGRGPFSQSLSSLRAIANYPHDDFLIFLASAEYGVSDLRALLGLSSPIRLVTGRRAPDGVDDVLTYCVDQIMQGHGSGLVDFAAWPDRSVLYAGPTSQGGNLLLEDEADAIFHEAQGNPMWGRITEARAMVPLSLDVDVLRAVGADTGLKVREIPADHAVGNQEPIPTLDFSGWLLFVDERMPDELAYALALACDRTRPEVERVIPDTSLNKPIVPDVMFGNVEIPLHPGVERYCREQGYL